MTDTLTIDDMLKLISKLNNADYEYRICPNCKQMRPDTDWTCNCDWDDLG